MNLFARHSGKSKLQGALDKDQAELGGVAIEELPSGPANVKENGPKPLFEKAGKSNGYFEVDLWGGWIKP